MMLLGMPIMPGMCKVMKRVFREMKNKVKWEKE
jgi:hypothetical protein